MAVTAQDGCYRSNWGHIVYHTFRQGEKETLFLLQNCKEGCLQDSSCGYKLACWRCCDEALTQVDSQPQPPFIHFPRLSQQYIRQRSPTRRQNRKRQTTADEGQTVTDDDGNREGKKSGQKYYCPRDLYRGTSELVCTCTKPCSLSSCLQRELSLLLLQVFVSTDKDVPCGCASQTHIRLLLQSWS